METVNIVVARSSADFLRCGGRMPNQHRWRTSTREDRKAEETGPI
jgi:hypothetical protein